MPMNDSEQQSKTQLRAAMRAELSRMTPPQRQTASHTACARLMQLDLFDQASVVMLYMPLSDEVDLLPLALRCFQMGKTVCVPKVNWERKDMVAVEVMSFDDHCMEVDEHGVRAPRDGRPVVVSSIDLVVVPGVAFDAKGNRLGRGGGFYDRFLKRLAPTTATVGLAFDLQIVDDVPVNERDIRMDMVVTDRRLTVSPRASTRR